jgi:hypothetical protein
VDFDGNWKWGRFYYNTSYPLQTLSGCQFDSAGAFLLTGLLHNVPVIININTTDGNVNSLIQIDPLLEDGERTSLGDFKTYYGIHHEVSDR